MGLEFRKRAPLDWEVYINGKLAGGFGKAWRGCKIAWVNFRGWSDPECGLNLNQIRNVIRGMYRAEKENAKRIHK